MTTARHTHPTYTLDTTVRTVPHTADGTLSTTLYGWLTAIAPDGHLYSWHARRTLDRTGHRATGWQLSVAVSATAAHNRLDIDGTVAAIVAACSDKACAQPYGTVVGWGQPPLDTLCTVLAPLVDSLARTAHRHWHHYFSLDDLRQECWLQLCLLHTKGYYIHKSLLSRTLDNSLYKQLRHAQDPRTTLSLDAPLQTVHLEDGSHATLGDILPDKQAQYTADDRLDNTARTQITDHRRRLVVDHIGQRAYTALLRAYRSHTVDSNTAATTARLRRKMTAKGYTTDYFRRTYYDD